MKVLNPETILKRANELYGQIKANKFPSIYARKPGPNLPLPVIQSDQVRALCVALCEAINRKPNRRSSKDIKVERIDIHDAFNRK